MKVFSNALFALSAAKGLTRITPNQTLRCVQSNPSLRSGRTGSKQINRMTVTAELNRWIRFIPWQRRVANLCETSVPMKVFANAPFALSVAKGLTRITPNSTLRDAHGERDLSRSIA